MLMNGATNSTAAYRPCIIIPCYNHGRELAAYLPNIVCHGVPVIVTDDGSAAEDAATTAAATQAHGATLIRLPNNRGKWHAIGHAVSYALAQGYTHALQCDADGQHDATAIPDFLQLGEQHRNALICGTPVYGADAPTARLKGRCISNFFVRIETAGACKTDSMCGFRLYPLHTTANILQHKNIMPGMPGDIEILVHFYWLGTPVILHPVKVCYPEGGRSNFRMLRDNILISWAHTKLCTAALLHPWRLWKAHKPH